MTDDAAAKELMRHALPKRFEGATSSYAADDFLADVETWVDAWSSKKTDAFRISTAVTFLDGAAKRWWVAQATKPTTWEAFKAALQANFKPVDDAFMARLELTRLEFRTGDNMQQFVERFRALMVRLPAMDQGDRVFAFTQALNAPLARAVGRAQPTTVEQAINVAVLDQATFASNQDRAEVPSRRIDRGSIPTTPLRPSRRDSSYLGIPPTPGTPAPGRISELNAIAKLTPETREECMRLGLCFRCRQPGHTAANCPLNNRSFRGPGTEQQ